MSIARHLNSLYEHAGLQVRSPSQLPGFANSHNHID